MWYTNWSGSRKSSVPLELTAPNGLNFVKSVGNPNSRLEKVRTYLRTNGPRTKKDILRDVFGKEVGKSSWFYDGSKMVSQNPHVVTRGWSTYLFGYGVRHGFFTKVRKGNTVLWSVR